MGNYDFELDLENVNTMSIINDWITAESTVLEFGAANGRLTKYLCNEKKCKMTIVEIDEESGREAAKYADEAYVGSEKGDIEKYHWFESNRKFDFIIFADVLEHLATPKDVLNNCKRLLQENGKVLISIPNVTHNSILIDMMNDRFDYQKTGLLDRTHIHFFTYKTFCEMATKCGFEICKVEPIYGRVGDIEISNEYSDVPIEVERYLRKRVTGSVYQYVFSLGVGESDCEAEMGGVEEFQLDKYIQLETQIYYREETSEYSESKKFSHKYYENEELVFKAEFEKNEKVHFLRWNPMRCSGIVYLQNASIQIGGEEFQLLARSTNAYWNCNNLFVFKEEEPWIEFEKLPENNKNIMVKIQFRIIDLKRTDEYYNQYIQQLKLVENEDGGAVGRINENLNEQLNECKKYIAHLEQDIDILNNLLQEKSALNSRVRNKIGGVLKRK